MARQKAEDRATINDPEELMALAKKAAHLFHRLMNNRVRRNLVLKQQAIYGKGQDSEHGGRQSLRFGKHEGQNETQADFRAQAAVHKFRTKRLVLTGQRGAFLTSHRPVKHGRKGLLGAHALIHQQQST